MKRIIIFLLCFISILVLTSCNKYYNCTKCDGDGAYVCPNCDGTGKLEDNERCIFCSGIGVFQCNLCKGKGKITEDDLPKVKWN